MQRRKFLKLGIAGAATVGGASLLGGWASAQIVNPQRAAPTTPIISNGSSSPRKAH